MIIADNTMLRKPIDFLAIGDLTTDAFIRLKEAEVHCKINTQACEICMSFGDKIPFESVQVIKAVGNAANAAVAAARLGLRAAIVTNLGDDQNGKECMTELQRNGIITSYAQIHKGKPTNYHFVLWYGPDRTILVNHIEYDYHLPKQFAPKQIQLSRDLPPKWIYLTSLAATTYPYHIEIADYLERNPGIRLAFQPGTFQMKLRPDQLERIYKRTDVFVVNVEEAQRILGMNADTEGARDIKTLMKSLASLGPKIVIITDNTNGAYMFDGDHHYHMPMYPDPRPALDRTGCGDAFASTFVSALTMNKSPLEALLWAPINPMSVAQFVGAQEGLLHRNQIERWIENAQAEF